jgi:hypothetical protein
LRHPELLAFCGEVCHDPLELGLRERSSSIAAIDSSSRSRCSSSGPGMRSHSSTKSRHFQKRRSTRLRRRAVLKKRLAARRESNSVDSLLRCATKHSASSLVCRDRPT